MIYLDYNASTPVDPRVRQAMLPYLGEWFGNPSAPHAMGRAARSAVDAARAQVASLLGASPEEVIFTSGGTEANNTAIKGVAARAADRGRHIITSVIEHPAVLNPCGWQEKSGYEITRVGVDAAGRVDPVEIERAIRPGTILISIMHANNEVGTIQPLAEISAIARRCGVPFHTDAAQSVGKIPTRVDELGVDLLSIAGHKCYAPQGVGALYVRKGISFEPLMHGAGHESGRRGGTEAVAMVVGLGVACELARSLIGDPAIRTLRDMLHEGLKAAFKGELVLHGHPELRLPNTLNVGFVGCRNGELLDALPGVCATAAAACHAGSQAISPVLAAMNVSPRSAAGAIRFSVGRPTTAPEIQAAVRLIAEAANANYSSTSTP